MAGSIRFFHRCCRLPLQGRSSEEAKQTEKNMVENTTAVIIYTWDHCCPVKVPDDYYKV